MKTLIFTIVLAAISAPGPVQSAGPYYGSGWYRELQLTVAHQNNINRAWISADRHSDNITSLGFGAGYLQKLGPRKQLELNAWLAVTRHHTFDALDHLGTSLELSWSYQPNPGFSNTWFVISGEFIHTEFDNRSIREGTSLTIDAATNKRLTPRLTGHLGARYRNRLRSESSAFDTTGTELYVTADYQLGNDIFMILEYSYSHGDFPANASESSGLVEPDEVRSENPVFGGWTYRLEADVHQLNVGSVFQYDRFNVDVSARLHHAESQDGIRYDDWLVQLGLIWLL